MFIICSFYLLLKTFIFSFDKNCIYENSLFRLFLVFGFRERDK